ncbi:MAG: glycosyl hydrolase family 28 protein [Dysgonamonadaceae bacterium]|nr:glycosyl hydrolase family 28 protein [Dysgonamonadaceae bacterium]MDD4727914.1 glycosyl hydrolase family 28 protein [Dysgonamonadaceae bacterium]
MTKSFFIHLATALYFILFIGCSQKTYNITPNQFKGSDTQRIQAAVDEAASVNGKVVIPTNNSNGSDVWLLDSAILLPSNTTIILDNCTIQLSDRCRDNMFRSKNVGIGITDPKWVKNIRIIGIGDVLLRGADNPRATGDGARVLVSEKQPGRVSYGSDAGKEGIKQKGDWRNIMILMAYVDGFKLKNVNIKQAHAWAVSHERVLNAEISDITFDSPQYQNINGKEVFVANRDGINLRHGCKYFRINNITGVNGDDLIALSTLGIDLNPEDKGGTLNSTMVTSRNWSGPQDNTEQVFITNCQTNYTGVGIRANDRASIHDVYINGVTTKARPDTPPPYGGSPYTLLVGGKGYGQDSQPGKINNIHAMNIVGDGKCLILIEQAIADCSFMNGVYTGNGDQITIYNIDKSNISNVTSQDLIKIKK